MSDVLQVSSEAESELRSRNRIRILIADDEPTLRASCVSVLERLDYDVETASRGDEARELMRRKPFDIALLDLHIPGLSGLELVKGCKENHQDLIPIIMTGQASVSAGIEAEEAGAWDFLPKPFTATHLEILLGRAAHELKARNRSGFGGQERTTTPQRQSARHTRNSDGPQLLGKSEVFLRTIRLAEQVARTNASVFLLGESGAGKEMIAQFIHSRSSRSGRKMMAVNCAALPETLLESELFGHCKGAFTGAVRDKPGLLEVADGGTFFLDELTEMPLAIQAKLLRVLQDGEVRRVGSERVDARVNVRFIAATNRPAAEATETGVLRRDLFYRLSVVPIRVPSLRERVEDIPLLAEHFLRLYWQRHRAPDEQLPIFGTAAMTALQEREWRGNVRELQNLIEHAVVVLPAGVMIGAHDIPDLEQGLNGAGPLLDRSRWTQGSSLSEVDYHTARDRMMAEFELNYLRDVITKAGANMSKAARMAGIDRTTLYRLCQKHGLHRDSAIRIDS